MLFFGRSKLRRGVVGLGLGRFEVESCVVAGFGISMTITWKIPTVAHPRATHQHVAELDLC